MGKKLKKLFRAIMDEVLPDDLSDLAATVKEVIVEEEDEITMRSRIKMLNKRLFKKPDLETIPAPRLLPEKEKKFADVDKLTEKKSNEASRTYETPRYARKKSKSTNIRNVETGKIEKE